MTRCSRSAGLAGVDAMPFAAIVAGPFQNGLAGELEAIVGDDTGGFAMDSDQGIQFPRAPGTRDADIHDQGEVFAAAIVVHCQDAELPAGTEGVGQEVQ